VHADGAQLYTDSAWWTLLLALAAGSAPVLCGALPARGGCYNACAAPGSGVCREARDGACVRYKEEHMVNGGKHGVSIRVRAAVTCTQAANTANCATGKCEMVGTTEVCTQCNQGKVPIDGVCTAKDSTTDKCKKAGGSSVDTNDKVCGQCGAGYFLHKGGCYKKGQQPGQTICTDAGSTQGHCKVCASGYFNNPAATDNAKESCIACGDATGADKYLGVANCAECTAPQENSGTGGTATCTACLGGFFGTESDDLTCTACDNACATCTGAGDTKCTSCKDTNPYFKKGDDETGECVAETDCNGNYFPNDDVDGKKQCIPCGDSAHGGIADYKTCAFSQVSDQSTLTCSVCTPATKKPNKEGTGCFACSVDGCSNCSKDGVCEACSGDKKVSSGGSSCVTNCPENSTGNENACICNSGFAPSGDSCAASSRQPQHGRHSRDISN
ncbi:Variant-specific surface protein, partial [Giardia duodenalis]